MIRPRDRSYGEISTFTRSPGMMRMKFFRIIPGDVSDHLSADVQFHTELRVRQGLLDAAFHFDRFLFRHVISLTRR